MKNKVLVLVGAVVAMIGAAAIGGAVVGAFFVYPSLANPAQPPAAHAAESGEGASASGPIYNLEERVLNLADKGSRRYVKIGVAVELKVPEDWDTLSKEAREKRVTEIEHEINKRAPILNDALTTTVSAKTSEQLADVDGKEALRDELKARFNDALGEPEITKVYLTDFLVQ